MNYLPIFLLLCILPCDAFANTLFLSYSVNDDKILCAGELNEQLIRVDADHETVIQLAQEVYDIVENKYHKRRASFEQGVAKLSNVLLEPFESMVRECNKIVITIDDELVKIPFEYLRLKEIELTTYRSILFRFPGTSFSKMDDVFSLSSGTIVRNKNCDPQNACKSIKKSNPGLTLYSSKSIDPDQLSKVGEDLLLISAHGHAYEKNRGAMGWNHSPVKTDLLKKLNPKITYFDSCQQGINLNYIEALLNADGLNYYIAPIISNDSGDSSTKTIKWFFEKIKAGLTPAVALLETKKQLNERYKRKRLLTRYNKSFSFRIYAL